MKDCVCKVHEQFSVLDGCFVLSQTIRSHMLAAQAQDESRCCSTPDLPARRRAQMNWEKNKSVEEVILLSLFTKKNI